MNHHNFESIIQSQQAFFAQGATKDISFRLAQLNTLKRALKNHERDILAALSRDLGKPPFEGYLTELYLCLEEINHTAAHLQKWARVKRVRTPWTLLAASSYIRPEPRGIALIIAPWNYPFQLLIMPLISAIAAGNCAVLKPSEHAPHTAALVAQIITEIFDPAFVTCIEGGIPETEALLREHFDYIFFTGSTRVGKLIMEAAARHITPLTLELGGKCPCIVDKTANLACAARRIAWGKFLNAGQNCISPDYLLVDETIKEPLIAQLKKYIQEFYGENPKESADYSHIITTAHIDRLARLLQHAHIITGGEIDRDNRYIAPTIIDNVRADHPCMQEEIFGPILPIITYQERSHAIALINQLPKPLAIYCFSQDNKFKKSIERTTSSGSICFNDVVIQISSPHLPFGGVGASGFGAYHGKAGFDTFSHAKAIMHHGCWADIPGRYPPYNKKISGWALKYLKFITR